jgi:timeless
MVFYCLLLSLQIVFALKKADFDAILLFLASSDEERELSLHVLEIISLMMREQNPADLAASAPGSNPNSRSSAVKDDDEAALMAARARELELKRQAEAKYAVR